MSELARESVSTVPANAADERQRGSLMSELARESVSTVSPRTRPTSASEEDS
jgi:hypothetical protein